MRTKHWNTSCLVVRTHRPRTRYVHTGPEQRDEDRYDHKEYDKSPRNQSSIKRGLLFLFWIQDVFLFWIQDVCCTQHLKVLEQNTSQTKTVGVIFEKGERCVID